MENIYVYWDMTVNRLYLRTKVVCIVGVDILIIVCS